MLLSADALNAGSQPDVEPASLRFFNPAVRRWSRLAALSLSPLPHKELDGERSLIRCRDNIGGLKSGLKEFTGLLMQIFSGREQ
jgi:hypothetical protein